MKDINATIIININGRTEEDIWRDIKYSRRKYVQQAKKSGLYSERSYSEDSMRKMYEMHMKTLEEGGVVRWDYDKWKDFVSVAGDKFWFIKKEDEIIGCYVLGEVDKGLYGLNHEEKGIRPLVFSSLKEYNEYRPNDYMYWETIKYALDNNFKFVDLGGWQINPRGHLKNVNQFKKQWGGDITFYYLDYPVITAIRRKMIRNFSVFWKINSYFKSKLGSIKKSAHDDQIRNAAARNLTSSSST